MYETITTRNKGTSEIMRTTVLTSSMLRVDKPMLDTQICVEAICSHLFFGSVQVVPTCIFWIQKGGANVFKIQNIVVRPSTSTSSHTTSDVRCGDHDDESTNTLKAETIRPTLHTNRAAKPPSSPHPVCPFRVASHQPILQRRRRPCFKFETCFGRTVVH